MKLIVTILLFLVPNLVYSKTKSIQTTGYVQSVEVLKKYITRDVPKKEKICQIKRVPISQKAQGFGADNLIGALIGGAIGNKLGQGGGKQGSTAIGALIGSEIVRNEKQAQASDDQFVEKEICKLQTITYTETSEQITGYKIHVEVDGSIIIFQSNRSYNVNDPISITKKINYFLN